MPTLAEVLDFIKEAKKNAKNKISDLINQEPQEMSMQGRANFLPYQDTIPGSVMNQRSFALPGVVAGAINAVTAPARSIQNAYAMDEAGNITPTFNAQEEAMNTAISTMGGGMGASRVAPPPAGSFGMNVFHGSPHKFDKFDSSKIGTGEGAQAYGHGLYFAENPQTARIYSADRAYVGSAMQGKPSTINFDDPAWIAQKTIDEFGDTSKATSHLKMVQRTASKYQSPETKAQVQAAIDLLESGNIATKGSLYKVDLPDAQIAKMLDWDKPLSQQPPEVQPVLREMLKKAKKSFSGIDLKSDPMAGQVHHLYASHRGGNAVEVAKELSAAGIPGIRYLDQGSRNTSQIGGGTSNFVVFDPKHTNIIGRE